MVSVKNIFKKLKILISDMISLNTPQAIVINIFSIVVFLILFPIKLLEKYPYVSVNRYLLPFIFGGIDNCPSSGIFKECCPSCGMTRAFSRLLRGDVSSALEHNKLIFIVVLIVLFLLIYNTYKWIRFYIRTGKIYPFSK